MTKSKVTLPQAVEQGYIVHVLAAENPYREGTNRHARFSTYKEGKKVETILADKRVKAVGFRWDVNAGLIKLAPPKGAKKEAPAKKEEAAKEAAPAKKATRTRKGKTQ
jgi:hypothetical protein